MAANSMFIFRDLETVLDGVRVLKDGPSQDISMTTAIDKLIKTEGITATLEQGMMWRSLSVSLPCSNHQACMPRYGIFASGHRITLPWSFYIV